MVTENEVTDIRVNVKRTDRRSVYINGEYAFSVSEGIFVEHGIAVGDRLTDEEIRNLVALDRHQRIKDAALTFLSYRPRSVQEMRRRLGEKGWSNQEIEPVIEELEKKDLLNDEEFAVLFARDRVQRKFLGPAALRYELKRMGIDQDLAERVIEDTYRTTPPEALIQSLLEARRIDLSRPVDRKERTRLINLLKRKGFSWAHMEPLISRLKTH
ncbi:MAG: regulatory protein RecX [Fidelibacterota bacterium]